MSSAVIHLMYLSHFTRIIKMNIKMIIYLLIHKTLELKENVLSFSHDCILRQCHIHEV